MSARPSAARRWMQQGASWVRPALLAAWRAAVRRRSRDVTDGAATRSALVLAPHPDDETLGCGAVIARKRAAGTSVDVLVVTDGRYSHHSAVVGPDELAGLRRAESLRACEVLGVPADHVHHLDLAEGTVAARHADVVAAIGEHLARLSPDEVLVTSDLDWHEDHRALSAAARDAVAHVPARMRPRLLEYPVWAWASGPWSNRPGRSAVRAAVDLVTEPVATARSLRPVHVRTSPEQVRAKRAAMVEYRTQTTNVTGEPTWAVMDEEFLADFLGERETFFVPGAGMGA